jgi:hypothetical protein
MKSLFTYRYLKWLPIIGGLFWFLLGTFRGFVYQDESDTWAWYQFTVYLLMLSAGILLVLQLRYNVFV